VQHVYKTSTKEVGKGTLQKYKEAGLLDEASDYHKNLYKHLRDGQQEHFRSSEEEKETLMKDLLTEKARFGQDGMLIVVPTHARV
jgi:hypothetical protein